jgi:hypothetical protein
MNSINYLPILVSALVAFGISSLWYSPFLFGKEWLALQKIDSAELDAAKKGVWKSYLSEIVMSLITFSVLGFIISLIAIRGSTDGAFLGILAWLGFILPSAISSLLWKKESLTLILIDSINSLVVLTIGGAIIGAWR